MKVKIINRGGYGDRHGKMHIEGAVVDFPDELAQKLIDRGFALRVGSKPEKQQTVTTAMFAPAENEALPAPVGRERKPKAHKR